MILKFLLFITGMVALLLIVIIVLLAKNWQKFMAEVRFWAMHVLVAYYQERRRMGHHGVLELEFEDVNTGGGFYLIKIGPVKGELNGNDADVTCR